MDKKKRELREEMLRLMVDLPSSYMLKADSMIINNLLDWDIYKEAGTIFTFVTMNNEINVIPIIEHAITTGKTVCAPKCGPKGKMDACVITNLNQIEKNNKGIPEPEDNCPIIAPEKIDLILVPCLSADTSCKRLGYGGGYYDRYLKNYSGHSVVLCREMQMVKKIPADSFDMSTGYYVTEKGLNRPTSSP